MTSTNNPDKNRVPSDNLLGELGRRRVLRAALIYAAVAWSITEVAAFLIEAIPVFPAWSKALIAIIFVVGFPVAMFLSWRFDLGPEGFKRTKAASTQGKLTIALALALLVGSTAGIFFLIYPSIVENAASTATLPPSGPISANTVAVLPFSLESASQDYSYLSIGLSDELRDRLNRMGGLRVAARSSSMLVKNSQMDARSIAARLGVARIIDGTLTIDGDTITVFVEIVDGESGFQDWTESFEARSTNLLDVQTNIGQQIAGFISPEFRDLFATTPAATLETSANDLMLLAGHNYQQVRENPVVDLEKLLRSIDLYRQAIAIDPESALAHSRLGAALLFLGDIEQAEEPVFNAYSLDPQNSEVQYTLGLYYWRRFLPGSRQAFERAIELNPNNVDALMAYGQALFAQNGEIDRANEYFERALELDPMSLTLYLEIGNAYGISGWRDESLRLAERIEERFDDPRASLALARIFELIGDLDVAIAWALKAQRTNPDYPDARWMLAELYTRIGDIEAAQYFEPEPGFSSLYFSRQYDAFIELSEDLALENPNQDQIWYGLARAHAAQRDYDQAIYVLEAQGLPANVLSDSRRTNGTEALVNYADSLRASGNIELATEIALWLQAHYLSGINNGMNRSWWSNLYLACTLSILDDDNQALTALEKIPTSTGLAWYPVLRDQPCFQKFENDARYGAVVNWIHERKAELREQLPDTLARFQSL